MSLRSSTPLLSSTKLGLGGHTFIAQLGNDPQPSFDDQCAIVAACLDHGILLMDTTYYQERRALGAVLQRLGRRDEAQITVWNFFHQPGTDAAVVPSTPYQPQHLPIMLAELQTSVIDLLVIHVHDDPAGLRRELELARRWRDEGKVKHIGLGMVQLAHLGHLPHDHPITHVLAPYNAFNQGAAAVFAAARKMGLRVIALSPFIRGWKLDEIGEDRPLVAELLLRWVTAQPLVDHVIVAMRRAEWVEANLSAEARGPLSDAEQARLRAWGAPLT